MNKYYLCILTFATALLIMAGCNKDSNEADSVQVNFIFNHLIGTETVQYDDIKYVNKAGNTYSVETLKYFVSDITLYQEDGTQVIIDAEHYVDARESTTLTFNPGVNLPLANYNKMSFIFGLSEAKNVAGRYPNPPESNMEWPPAMGTGYHYMKLEGKFDSAGVIKNYQAHTGPTMGNQNFVTVVLTQDPFSCNCTTVDIRIDMDINKWWQNPNTLDLNNMSMVMGNQEMQEKLQANGSDVFSLTILK